MARCPPFCGYSSVTCLEYYALLYALLVVTQMMLDVALYPAALNVPHEFGYELNIYQCILLPVHFIQATIQFFFMFDLYKAIIKKSYQRVRNWRMVFLCLLSIEVSAYIAYMAFAFFLSPFTYVTTFAILFKVYLIWPLGLFLADCGDNEVCVPLAHVAVDDQQQQGCNVLDAFSNRPGPSGYSTSSQ